MILSRSVGTLTLVGDEAIFFGEGGTEVHLMDASALSIFQACDNTPAEKLRELGPDADRYIADLLEIGALHIVAEQAPMSGAPGRRRFLELAGRAAAYRYWPA